MGFSVEEFQDLVRLLGERPQWREELRLLLLPADFTDPWKAVVSLSDKVGDLAEAQGRTEERVAALAEAQGRTEERVAALAEAQGRTEERLGALISQVESIAGAMDQLIKLTRVMEGRVSKIDGLALEQKYQQNPASYFGRIAHRIKVLTDEEIFDLLEPALAQGLLTKQDIEEIRLADLIIRGRRPDGSEAIYLVVEVSWGIGVGDVQRASHRARRLERAGVETIPLVAGESVIPDAEKAAARMKVWQVTDGKVFPPENGDHSSAEDG